jgi:hypothetical protein
MDTISITDPRTFPDPLGPTSAILLLCSMPRCTSAKRGREGLLASFLLA